MVLTQADLELLKQLMGVGERGRTIRAFGALQGLARVGYAAPWRCRKKNGQSIHFWFRPATIRFERQHNRCEQREVEYVEQIRGSAFCDFHVYWDGKRQGRPQALPLLHRRHGQSNLCLQHGYIRTLSCAV
jgi:hypothetical protein